MTTLIIEGQKVKVDPNFMQLSPEEQESTVEEIAASLGVSAGQSEGVMPNVNAGIADTFDAINPFNAVRGGLNKVLGTDLPTDVTARQHLPEFGIDLAEGDPQTLAGNFGRGAGQAAAALPLAVGGIGAIAARGSGVVANVADDAYRALSTKSGVVTEAIAGGTALAAGQAAENAGAPEWLQGVAEVAAPTMALPAAGAALRGTANLASKTPGVAFARRTGEAVKRSIVPMTEAGAEEVAAERLRGLVGGEDRAAALGQSIRVDDPLGLTPAQQTGDPNLLALEQQGATENPLMRERLAARAKASRTVAASELQADGHPEDTAHFFAQRLKEHKSNLQSRAEWVKAGAFAEASKAGPRSTETQNSAAVVDAVKGELSDALTREKQLWGAIPQEANVPTTAARAAAQGEVSATAFAQRDDIPRAVSDIVESDLYADQTTVAELYGAYSKLRQVARSAMAGTNQNKNTARIANRVADAILEDLGATDGATGVGRAINDARAFSAALHETYDQGTVGRILNRTIDGDTQVHPETALRRTVGPGGAAGKVATDQIEAAAGGTSEGIQDFLRWDFTDRIKNASGEFTPKAARKWLRDNREILAKYPALRSEFASALANGDNATAFAARADARAALADRGPLARFNGKESGKAVLQVISSRNPAQEARALVRTARKDKTGKAMAGLKAGFSDYLITGGTDKSGALRGDRLLALLRDKQNHAALAQVFTGKEIGRMRRIGVSLSKIDATTGRDVGAFMDSPANQMLDAAVRIAAARQGGEFAKGSMGGSLQTANIFSSRARDMLRNLSNDRARELLMDAIEDPELFKALLRTPAAIEKTPKLRSKLAPYFVGAAAAQSPPEESNAQ